MISFKKILTMVLIFALILGTTMLGDSYAADLKSSYNNLKDDYPEFIETLKVAGADDTQIEAFMDDLQNEVESYGTITEENINHNMFLAISEVIQWGKHRKILQALLMEYSTEIDYILNNNEIPEKLSPLHKSVKASILGTEQEEEDQTNDTSSKGSGSSTVTQPKTDLETIADEVKKQLKEKESTVSLESEDSQNFKMTAASLKEIFTAEKELEITMGNVRFRLAPDAVIIDHEKTLEINAKPLSSTKAKSALEHMASGQEIVGSVYKFSMNTEALSDTANFAKAVTVELSYDKDQLKGISDEYIDIFYYDEEQAQWIRQNGEVNREKGTIIIKVEHFSQYAIMTYTPETEEVQLNDIASHWAEGNIKKLIASGAINGYPDGTFKPDARIKRAEFATILVKAFNLEAKTGKVFADTANHWGKDAISTAAAYGIVGGYDDTTFGPEDDITREQMALMIVRAAKLDTAATGKSFEDGTAISGWAANAVNTAFENGIISGYPDNTFKPQGNAKRAEAVTVIVNALK